MKKISLLIFCTCLVILQSCSRDTENLPEVKLNMTRAIDQFTDSTYFTDIRSVYATNNKFYLSDYNRDQVFILDDELTLLNTIGMKGRGPGEFQGVSHLFVNNDTIYAYNDFMRSFEVYFDERHVKTIKCPTSITYFSYLRFFNYNKTLYISNASAENSLCSYDYKSDSIIFFGEVKKYSTQKETRVKNSRHILKYQDLIIAIPDGQPSIEIYHENGQLKKHFDLSEISPIKNVLKFVRKQKQLENSYYTLFSDVNMYRNKIYLLFSTVDQKDRLFSNKILELSLTNSTLTPIRILDLGPGWFGAFGVTENSILAIDSKNDLLKQFQL